MTTAQVLARLRHAGLARYQTSRLGPLLGSRPVRLWTLTAAGHALVASRGPLPSAEDASQLNYGAPERWRDPARQRDVPLLVACYRLLAEVAAGLDQPARVCAFEHPWIRTFRPTEGARRRRVHLPAAAVLQTRQADDGQPLRVLLLPDLGTAPLSSHRPMLQALIELRRTALTNMDVGDEPVVVVGVATPPSSSTARVRAWRSLLHEVARRTDEQPLRARVFECATLLARLRDARDRRLPGEVDEVFALVARQPLLTRKQLAALLRTSAWRIAHLESDLIERGWLRPVLSNDLPLDASGRTRDRLQSLGLVELTEAGRKEAARRLLVPAGLARRRHGLIRTAVARRRLLRHFQHTLGANAFFVELAGAAMQVTGRGGNEALLEWRSAAACARGRFRPDGYGCYRRGAWQFGFFLEYDRGTERSRHYAAKLATYYRHRDSGAYARDYRSFPTLLVVTTSEPAEERFAHEAYLAQQRYGGMPLRVFLTTTDRIQSQPHGALGSAWRSAQSSVRVSWLSATPSAHAHRG